MERRREYWFDADGDPVDGPELALTGEIIESDAESGAELRTYIDLSSEGTQLVSENPLVTEEDQDWPKESWDVRVGSDQRPVETLSELRGALGRGMSQSDWREKLANMLGLPVWEHVPEQLKREAYDWLESTRPVK